MNVVVGHGLAAQRALLALKSCEASRPPDILTMTPPTSTPGHALGRIDRKANGMLGRLQVDDARRL